MTTANEQSESPAPSELSVRCPRCGHQLWRKRGGEWLLDSSAVKMVDGQMAAKCGRRGSKRGCGAVVPIPWLTVNNGDGKPRRRRLMVRAGAVPG